MSSITAQGSILDREIDGLHDLTPIHLGNEDLIERPEAVADYVTTEQLRFVLRLFVY